MSVMLFSYAGNIFVYVAIVFWYVGIIFWYADDMFFCIFCIFCMVENGKKFKIPSVKDTLVVLLIICRFKPQA